MDLLLAFAVFLGGIFLCMALDWSLAIGLALGLVCFSLVARRRGNPWREVAAMAGQGVRTAMVVLRVLLVIGCLTGLWRASGTIAFFVYTGLKLITPHIFLLAAFLLSTVMSLTFGSAFGVAGTAGVVLAVMAAYSAAYDFDAIIPISAEKRDGLEELMEQLSRYASEGPQLFPDGMTTDQPEKQVVIQQLTSCQPGGQRLHPILRHIVRKGKASVTGALLQGRLRHERRKKAFQLQPSCLSAEAVPIRPGRGFRIEPEKPQLPADPFFLVG